MKFNEIIDGVKDSINDTKLQVVKAVDDAELDKRAKEFGNVAGDKLKSIDIQKRALKYLIQFLRVQKMVPHLYHKDLKMGEI